MNTPAAFADELVRRGCRVVVRGGAAWVVSPDDFTRAWVRRHEAYLRAHRAEILAAVQRVGGEAVDDRRPPGCDGRRCGACEPLRFVPLDFGAFRVFRGCHWT